MFVYESFVRVSQVGDHVWMWPKIYLGSTVLSDVKEFRYLGHRLAENFTDDTDIEHKLRSMSIRGNIMYREVH